MMRRFRCLVGLVACTAGVLSMLAGCQGKKDKLAYDNFMRIQQTLSTQGEVVQILGQPDHVLGNRWIYELPDEHLTAFVDFDEGGRVESKQWIDGSTGVWEDSRAKGAPKP